MGTTLLQGNRRAAFLFACLAITAGLLLAVLWAVGQATTWLVIVGLPLLLATIVLCGLAAWVCFRPRLVMDDETLRVYLRAGPPIRIPLDVVEVFFIGQGAARGGEPGQPRGYQGPVAANVIIRLAESASEWKERDVNRPLGIWKDGYITVRGLWCENIDAARLKTMNRHLLDVKRKRKSQS